MKEIAFRDNMVAEEKLPFPFVLYPGFYGAFLGFKKSKNNTQIFFCSCSREAIQNYIKMRLTEKIPENSDPARMFILDSLEFPMSCVESLMKKNAPKDKRIIEYLKFENKICHECNRATPSYRYCHEMYGGTFKQNYGWYIQKLGYEWGVTSTDIDFEICPQEIMDLLEIEAKEYFRIRQELVKKNWNKAQELDKRYGKQQRKIWNAIENEVREKFGHKKIGEAWTSETILYYIIQNLFSGKTIFRHYRPEFLEGLELDIFIKEFNLGIEYQGIQHYKPIKHWGGKAALKNLQARDQKKKKICEQLGVKLVYFDYDEELSNDFVLKKIKEYISNEK